MTKYYSLDEFKKWIDDQPEKTNESVNPTKAEEVRSRLPLRRLMSKSEIQEGKREHVCQEFHEEGGTVIGEENNKVLVEVSSGKFRIHRMYVKSIL